jgi:hypothetical protein
MYSSTKSADGVLALALGLSLAHRFLTRLALLELRVFALLGVRGRFFMAASRALASVSGVAQDDFAQCPVLRAVAIEEDFLARSRAAHAQSGDLGVAALLAGRHVGDNRRGQGLRLLRCRFSVGRCGILPPSPATYTATYTDQPGKDLQILARS